MPKNVKVEVTLIRRASFNQTIEMPADDYKRLLQRLEDNDREVGEEIFDLLPHPDEFDWADQSIDATDIGFEIERPTRQRR